jgi:hypothetical protein
MNSVIEDDLIYAVDGLPLRHVAFYGKVVSRLIEAGELPAAAKAKFKVVFSAGFLRSIITCKMPI